jgi:Permuted papain-like amidase enzyme, YaeF/YiiX, C92 family
MMQRRWFVALFALSALSPLPSVAATGYPPLRNGDLVFQNSRSGQSSAVLAATGHPFTHMGMVRVDGDQVFVIEAVGPVVETPFAAWVAQGDAGHIAIYRYRGLDVTTAAAVVAAAQGYAGRPYDIFFAFDNAGIYCSELPYLAYGTVGITLGTVQTLGELNIDDAAVQALIAARWQDDPACAAGGQDFEGCYALLMERAMITPAAIAMDPRLQRLYTDFPL